MTAPILPFLKPLNSRDAQPKPSNISDKPKEMEKNSFSKEFDTAVEKNKVMSTSDSGNKGNKMVKSQESDSSFDENISAQEFLKKMGIEDSDIQKIIQEAGLDENISMIEFIDSFNFQITDFNDFLEISIEDFVSQLGIGKDEIEQILQPLISKTSPSNKIATDGEPESMSLKNLMQETVAMSEKNVPAQEINLSVAPEAAQKINLPAASEVAQEINLPITPVSEAVPVHEKNLPISPDLANAGDLNLTSEAAKVKNESADNFFQKLGIDNSELKNLMKELGLTQESIDKLIDDPKNIKAADLLTKIGLNSDEISKLIEKSIEEFNQKNSLKEMLLGKDLNGLKKLALLDTGNVNFSDKTDLQSIFQGNGDKGVSEVTSGKIQSEIISSINTAKETLSAAPQTSTSGNDGNAPNMNNGTSGLAAQLAESSKEIQATDLRLNETTPKSFFERTVVDQIVSKVSFKMTGGQEEIRIHLDPPSLGSLHLKISVDQKVVNATIIAENSFTKDIIQSNIQQLKDSMIEQGLKLDSLSVSVGGDDSRQMTMGDTNSSLTDENLDPFMEYENENPDDLLDQNSGIFEHVNGLSAQSGVDFFA